MLCDVDWYGCDVGGEEFEEGYVEEWGIDVVSGVVEYDLLVFGYEGVLDFEVDVVGVFEIGGVLVVVKVYLVGFEVGDVDDGVVCWMFFDFFVFCY